MIICAGIILIFDHAYNCNYWFMIRPVRGTPLQFIYDRFGTGMYLPALAMTVTAVNVLMYGILKIFIIMKIVKKENR